MNRIVTSLVLFVVLASSQAWAADWKSQLEAALPLLGHRNWIAVVDSAYPAQTSEGIKMVYSDWEQIDVVRHVLHEVNQAKHVAPIIYTDAELKHVPEALANGIDRYREDLDRVLEGQTVNSLPHEEIIAKLDEAGETFRIFVVKTPLTLPYTSVFIQLDCGYWGPEAEAQMRSAMGEAQ